MGDQSSITKDEKCAKESSDKKTAKKVAVNTFHENLRIDNVEQNLELTQNKLDSICKRDSATQAKVEKLGSSTKKTNGRIQEIEEKLLSSNNAMQKIRNDLSAEKKSSSSQKKNLVDVKKDVSLVEAKLVKVMDNNKDVKSELDVKIKENTKSLSEHDEKILDANKRIMLLESEMISKIDAKTEIIEKQDELLVKTNTRLSLLESEISELRSELEILNYEYLKTDESLKSWKNSDKSQRKCEIPEAHSSETSNSPTVEKEYGNFDDDARHKFKMPGNYSSQYKSYKNEKFSRKKKYNKNFDPCIKELINPITRPAIIQREESFGHDNFEKTIRDSCLGYRSVKSPTIDHAPNHQQQNNRFNITASPCSNFIGPLNSNPELSDKRSRKNSSSFKNRHDSIDSNYLSDLHKQLIQIQDDDTIALGCESVGQDHDEVPWSMFKNIIGDSYI